MKINTTQIKDVLIIEPDIYEDSRGYFMEIHHYTRYSGFLSQYKFVQDNISFSFQGALRGLHFQKNHPQAKLVQAISGIIFDVAVDVRHDSSTFGKWVGEILSEMNHHQMFIPEGFAHGFCVLSETAYVLYKCTDVYFHGDDKGILWSDPGIGINWPIIDPILSEKDNNLPALSILKPEQLPSINNLINEG